MTSNKRGKQVNRRQRISGNRSIIILEIAVIVVLMIIATCVVSAAKGYVKGPGVLTQEEIDDLLLDKVPTMTKSFEPYYGELRGNRQLNAGSISLDDYEDTMYWNKNVLIEEGGLIAQNDDWYFGPYDEGDYSLCAINKKSGKKVKLTDFEAANINYYNGSLYFTNVEYSLEDHFVDYDIATDQKIGGKLYRIDRIDEIDVKTDSDDIVVYEMGKPGYAYFKLDVNAGGVYTLIVNTETENDRTGYVTLDENGEQAGVILAPEGENIVTYVEKDGYVYIEMMVEDDAVSGTGERYIICVDRDHGTDNVTKINGTSLHYCCGHVVFQSTEDMYLYAIDESHQSAYVISQYPVSTFTVFGDYIDAIAANRTHNSLRIGKNAENPFSSFCMLDVNGWTNYISVTPKAIEEKGDKNKKDKKEKDNPEDEGKINSDEKENSDGQKSNNKPGGESDNTENNQQTDADGPKNNVTGTGKVNGADNGTGAGSVNGADNGTGTDSEPSAGLEASGNTDGGKAMPVADIKPENYKGREGNVNDIDPIGELPKLFEDEQVSKDSQGTDTKKENETNSSNINKIDDEPTGPGPTLVSTDGIIKAVDEYINYVTNNGVHRSEPQYSAKGSKDFENRYFKGKTIREYMVENFGILGDVKKYKGDTKTAEHDLKEGTADFMLDLYSKLSVSYEIKQLSTDGRKAVVRFNQHNHLDLNGVSEQAVRRLSEEYKNSGKYTITEWAEDDAMYRVKATLWMLPQLLYFVPGEYSFDVIVTYDDKNKVWNIAHDLDDYSIEQIFLPEEGMQFTGSIDEKSVSAGSGDKTDLTDIASKMGKDQGSSSETSRLKNALILLSQPKKRVLVHKESAYKGNPYKNYIKLLNPDEYMDRKAKKRSFNDSIKILVSEDREKVIDRAKERIKGYEDEIKRVKSEGLSYDEELDDLNGKIESLEWAITQIKLAQGSNVTKISEKIKDFWQSGQDFAYRISDTKSNQMIIDERERDIAIKNRVAKEELLPAMTEIMYYGRFGEKLTGHYDNWDYNEHYYEWKEY